ncbi:MAG TPA: hypothetical protein IAB18_06590 [Candidatus Avisuccinivibrio pullicola]|nr:hypothetical protein [Candidatus Avisuccinivibrio pullicola]
MLTQALEALHLSPEAFAVRIHYSAAALKNFLNGKNNLTAELTLRISRVMPGPDAACRLRLQADYSLWQTRQRLNLSSLNPLAFS